MYVIDACVYVSSIRKQEPQHKASRLFLGQVRAQQAPVKSPETLVVEVAGALGRGTEGSADAMSYALGLRRLPGHQFIPVDRELADLAAKVGAEKKLKGMDAIYAALADKEGARLITVDNELINRAPAASRATGPEAALAALRAQRTSP